MSKCDCKSVEEEIAGQKIHVIHPCDEHARGYEEEAQAIDEWWAKNRDRLI